MVVAYIITLVVRLMGWMANLDLIQAFSVCGLVRLISGFRYNLVGLGWEPMKMRWLSFTWSWLLNFGISTKNTVSWINCTRKIRTHFHIVTDSYSTMKFQSHSCGHISDRGICVRVFVLSVWMSQNAHLLDRESERMHPQVHRSALANAVSDANYNDAG